MCYQFEEDRVYVDPIDEMEESDGEEYDYEDDDEDEDEDDEDEDECEKYIYVHESYIDELRRCLNEEIKKNSTLEEKLKIINKESRIYHVILFVTDLILGYVSYLLYMKLKLYI